MFTFSLFRIPVAVRFSFLVMAGLLGFVTGSDAGRIAAWVVIVFLSILIHELGHAFTARSMGAEVKIELNGFGGLTRWSVPAEGFGPGKRALVAASGSAVGVAVGGVIWVLAAQFDPYSGLALFVINTTIYVNLFWGLLNWVPIRPLDGGHLLLSLLEKIAPNRSAEVARVVFALMSAAALVWALTHDLVFIAILAGWMLLAELNPARPQRAPVTGRVPQFSYDEPVVELDGGDVEEPVDAEWEERDN